MTHLLPDSTVQLWREPDAAGIDWLYIRWSAADGVHCLRAPHAHVVYTGPEVGADLAITCSVSANWEAVPDRLPPP